MITMFDAVAPILILLAMALSTQPKQTAIGICALVSVSITFVDYFVSGTPQYYMFMGIEFTAFWVLLGSTHFLKDGKNRNYFRLMASMLLLSLLGTWVYLTDAVVFSTYLLLWKAIAVTHIGIMLVYSDGIRLAGNRLADMYRGRDNRAVH